MCLAPQLWMLSRRCDMDASQSCEFDAMYFAMRLTAKVLGIKLLVSSLSVPFEVSHHIQRVDAFSALGMSK